MDSHDYASYEYLKHCLYVEVIKSDNKRFSWFRVLRRYYHKPRDRFIFWWRIASYLHKNNHYKIAYYINRKITMKYGPDISLDARIAPGLSFSHFCGIVIAGIAVIGENFHIRQNTTIGAGGSRFHPKSYNNKFIKIGDNVEIGANSCIIGDALRIGNNVIIGAMSFVNKDIPDNCVCYTKKENTIISNIK